MKMTTWKCGCMAAALAATSVMPPCVFADSTVTASREYVDRQFEAALGYVDSALENLWLTTTNAIEEAIAGIHGPTNDVPQAATSLPEMAGTPRAGTSNEYARADHVHPSDTNKLDKIGGTVQDLHIQTADDRAWRLTDGKLVKETETAPGDGWHSIYDIEIPYPRDNSSRLALAAEDNTFTPGNLAALDSQGNPVDSHISTNTVALTPAEYSDAPTFTEWEYSGLDSRFTVMSGPRYYPRPQYGEWYWDVVDTASGEECEAYARSDDANATNLVAVFDIEWGTTFTFTATRTRTDVTGYALGSQTNKVLASTLAVDRLWERSTNSFLKAEWETDSGDMLYRIDQNPYSGSIDLRWRWSNETNWSYSAARFYPWSLEYRDEDYIDLDAGENVGLWIGADSYGENNITGGGYIGYCKGFVTLKGSGYDDYIYFPTGVGGGRDNVFALTKDIDRATNALSGVVSPTLTKNLGDTWNCDPETDAGGFRFRVYWDDGDYKAWMLVVADGTIVGPEDINATSFTSRVGSVDVVATRTVFPGYILGPNKQSNPNRDKPLASVADATLTPVYSKTPTFTEWVCEPASVDGVDIVIKKVSPLAEEKDSWIVTPEPPFYSNSKGNADSVVLTWAVDEWSGGVALTATRTRTDFLGYQLGDQSDKILAASGESGGSDKMKPVAWLELKAMRDSGHLSPGASYCITNYVATTNGDMDSRSANHPFDIIVTADDEHALNEHVRAVIHEGDTYFAGCDLAAWDVWYCLDNDTSRFAWAVTNGGKGVVYRLVDEFQNDVPYDFKGLQFIPFNDNVVWVPTASRLPATGEVWKVYYARDTDSTLKWNPDWDEDGDGVVDEGEQKYLPTDDTAFRYTFDSGAVSNNTDCSRAGFDNCVVFNKISPYLEDKQMLNCIVFKGQYCYDNTFGPSCFSNTFGDDCAFNTFGSGCCNNTFGSDCYFNTFGSGCSDNTFGKDCENNTFGSGCYFNTFGSYCYYNTFGSCCYSNTFGPNCENNTFGPNCDYNTFGSYCYSNRFGSECAYNAFGSRCYYNTFGSYCYSNSFGPKCCGGDWSYGSQRYAGTVVRYDNALHTVQKRYRAMFSYSLSHPQTYLPGETLYYDSQYWECTTEHNGAWDEANFTKIQLVGVDGILSANEYVPRSYYRCVELEDGVSYVALDCTTNRADNVYYQNVTVSKGIRGTESAPKHIEDTNHSQGFKTTYQPADSLVIPIPL